MRQQYPRLVVGIPTRISAGLLTLLFLSCLKSEEPQDIQDEIARSRSGSLYQACAAGQPEWIIRLDGGTAGEEDYVLPVSSRDSIQVGATFEQGDVAILIDSMDSGHVYGGFEVRENDTALITGRFTLTKVLETPVCGQPGLTCSDSLPPIRLDGEWAWRMEPYTSSEQTPHAVVWTGERLVAVGVGGSILTSSDGLAWTEQASGTSHTLFAVTCAPQGLVAVGTEGVVLRSPDGLSWKSAHAGVADTLVSVTWAQGRFVAISHAGTIVTSSDGTTWETRSTGDYKLRAVAASGDHFVAVGNGGVILGSTDGIIWTRHTSGTTFNLVTVIWSGERFVAYSVLNPGTGRIALESSEGSMWSSFSTACCGQAWPHFIQAKKLGSSLVGMSWHGNDHNLVMASTDGGATWMTVDMPFHYVPADLAWTGERLVVVGYNGGILTLP